MHMHVYGTYCFLDLSINTFDLCLFSRFGAIIWREEAIVNLL